jgi:hypothetical protein
MFRNRFTNIASRCSCVPVRSSHRAQTKAVGLAITGLLLASLSGTAMAQGGRVIRIPDGGLIATPIVAQPTASDRALQVLCVKLKCLDVSNDNTWPRSDLDEPYILTFTADLRGGGARGWVSVSSEFSDVESGSTRFPCNYPSWLSLLEQQQIRSQNDYIFLTALLESDDSSERTAIRNAVSNVMLSKLASYKAAGMSRATMVSNLTSDMNLAIDGPRDDDDRVGGVQEVLFDAAALQAAWAGSPTDRLHNFVGNGSQYQITFQVGPAPPLN